MLFGPGLAALAENRTTHRNTITSFMPSHPTTVKQLGLRVCPARAQVWIGVHCHRLFAPHNGFGLGHWDCIIVSPALAPRPPIPPDETDHFRSLIGLSPTLISLHTGQSSTGSLSISLSLYDREQTNASRFSIRVSSDLTYLLNTSVLKRGSQIAQDARTQVTLVVTIRDFQPLWRSKTHPGPSTARRQPCRRG